MKKCLKTNDCLQKIISQDLIPLLFVNDSAFRDGWIYNFFYDVVIDDETLVFADNDCFEKYGCFLNYSYRFPVARSRDFAPVSKRTFVNRLKSFIDDENYVVAIYNEPDENNHFLLYGYDDEQECFMVYIFRKDRFVMETIPYDEIMDSIIEQSCKIVDGRIEVYCYKENKYYKEYFNISTMFDQIKAFLNEETVGSLGKIGLHGIEKFLNKLADRGNNRNFIKSLKCLEQHLLFMNERLNYILARYDMKDEPKRKLEASCEKITEVAATIRLLGNIVDMLPMSELKQRVDSVVSQIYMAYQSVYESYPV